MTNGPVLPEQKGCISYGWSFSSCLIKSREGKWQHSVECQACKRDTVILLLQIFERQSMKEKKIIRIILFHIKDKDVLNVKKQPEVMGALPGFLQVCFVYSARPPNDHEEKGCKLAWLMWCKILAIRKSEVVTDFVNQVGCGSATPSPPPPQLLHLPLIPSRVTQKARVPQTLPEVQP